MLLVDVLEFVDRNPSPTAVIAGGETGVGRQGAYRERDEIVEVDPIARRERAAVRGRRLSHAGACPALGALLLGDGAQKPLGLGGAEIERLGEQCDALRFARDSKAAVQAGRASVLAQDGKAERMEGVNRNLFGAVRKQR